jgi:hypothetical protein
MLDMPGSYLRNGSKRGESKPSSCAPAGTPSMRPSYESLLELLGIISHLLTSSSALSVTCSKLARMTLPLCACFVARHWVSPDLRTRRCARYNVHKQTLGGTNRSDPNELIYHRCTRVGKRAVPGATQLTGDLQQEPLHCSRSPMYLNERCTAFGDAGSN